MGKTVRKRIDKDLAESIDRMYPHDISFPAKTVLFKEKIENLMFNSRKTLRDKRGSIQDLLFIGLVMVVIAITILVMAKVSSEINAKLQGNDLIPTRAQDSYAQINDQYSGVIDNSMIFLMGVLCFMALSTAFLVRVHPFFLVAFIILLGGIIFLAATFSEIYTGIASNEDMIAVAESLTFTTLIMRWLPLFVGVFGSILAIVMYKGYRDNVV